MRHSVPPGCVLCALPAPRRFPLLAVPSTYNFNCAFALPAISAATHGGASNAAEACSGVISAAAPITIKKCLFINHPCNDHMHFFLPSYLATIWRDSI